jgi:hypothetical protein
MIARLDEALFAIGGGIAFALCVWCLIEALRYRSPR